MKRSITVDIETIANKFGLEGKIIGFANKFYTLWEYKITKNEDNGELAFDAFFIKNIGLENPYGDAYPFDVNLKGTEIHITHAGTGTGFELNKLELKALKFSKNPYRGFIISEFNDLETLCWKYNASILDFKRPNMQIEAEKTNMVNRIIELGGIKVEDIWYTPEKASAEYFSCNPSVNTKITSCWDDGLLCWKYNRHAVSYRLCDTIANRELDNIKTRAIELGAVEINGKLYSVKNQSESWFKELANNNEDIEKGNALTITPAHNLCDDGSLLVSNNIFKFDYRWYPATYYGPEYTLPLDSKGNAKRIKNKTITIKKYEKVEEPKHVEMDGYGEEHEVPAHTYYKVLDWEFVK